MAQMSVSLVMAYDASIAGECGVYLGHSVLTLIFMSLSKTLPPRCLKSFESPLWRDTGQRWGIRRRATPTFTSATSMKVSTTQ